ncbi:unnamed protein product, partial [Ectocarpus sp. 6 AP-2014]
MVVSVPSCPERFSNSTAELAAVLGSISFQAQPRRGCCDRLTCSRRKLTGAKLSLPLRPENETPGVRTSARMSPWMAPPKPWAALAVQTPILRRGAKPWGPQLPRCSSPRRRKNEKGTVPPQSIQPQDRDPSPPPLR